MLEVVRTESQFGGDSPIDTGYDSEGKDGLSAILCE